MSAGAKAAVRLGNLPTTWEIYSSPDPSDEPFLRVSLESPSSVLFDVSGAELREKTGHQITQMPGKPQNGNTNYLLTSTNGEIFPFQSPMSPQAEPVLKEIFLRFVSDIPLSGWSSETSQSLQRILGFLHNPSVFSYQADQKGSPEVSGSPASSTAQETQEEQKRQAYIASLQKDLAEALKKQAERKEKKELTEIVFRQSEREWRKAEKIYSELKKKNEQSKKKTGKEDPDLKRSLNEAQVKMEEAESRKNRDEKTYNDAKYYLSAADHMVKVSQEIINTENKIDQNKKDWDILPESELTGRDDLDEIVKRNPRGLNWYKWETDVKIGKYVSQELEEQAKIVGGPIGEYVNNVVQDIVKQSGSKFTFNVKVVYDESVNAFALPGGFVYVTTGLLNFVDSEAELAGIMAHETAHVNLRHAMKQATKGDLLQISFNVLYILCPYCAIFTGGGLGTVIGYGLNFGIPAGFLYFSRKYEREADVFGMYYMARAGYDPKQVPAVFRKLYNLEKYMSDGRPLSIYMDHPATSSRVIESERLATVHPQLQPEYLSNQLGIPGPLINTQKFDDIKKLVAQMMEGIRAQRKLKENPESDSADKDDKGCKGKEDSKDCKDGRPTLKKPK